MQQLNTPEQVDAWLDTIDRSPACVELRDLSPFHDRLVETELSGTLFLGCDLPREVASRLVGAGASVIGALPPRRFRVHRPFLYDVDELFAGFDPSDPDGHLATLDHLIYEEYLDDGGPEPSSIAVSLAQRLHDHAITDGIRELVDGRRVVAIMGGHALERRSPTYGHVARMARSLTRSGYLTASGGGPGAMEATHLGAWFAGRPDHELDEALASPFAERPAASTPNREYADADWLHRAMALRGRYPLAGADRRRFPSLGIPTWLYGHEPPAVFATHIGKYFANSVREDGLLALAKHGVVFAPGSAGTIQEIFQDLTQNHYGTHGVSSPMVLFDAPYWTQTKPVWPLLSSLAEGQRWGELLHLTSDPDEAVELLKAYEPLHHLWGTPDLALESALRRQLTLRGNVHLRHVAEAATPSARVVDASTVRSLAAQLLTRLERRPCPATGEAMGAVHQRHDPASTWAAWLSSFLDDDWLAPTRASQVLRGLHEEGRLGDAFWLPEAPVHAMPAEVPARGVLVRVLDGRASLWLGGLAD